MTEKGFELFNYLAKLNQLCNRKLIKPKDIRNAKRDAENFQYNTSQLIDIMNSKTRLYTMQHLHHTLYDIGIFFRGSIEDLQHLKKLIIKAEEQNKKLVKKYSRMKKQQK